LERIEKLKGHLFINHLQTCWYLKDEFDFISLTLSSLFVGNFKGRTTPGLNVQNCVIVRNADIFYLLFFGLHSFCAFFH